MVKDHSDSHIGYSFRLAARIILYASSHRHENTYHSLCYTIRGVLAGTRRSDDPSHHVVLYNVDKSKNIKDQSMWTCYYAIRM